MSGSRRGIPNEQRQELVFCHACQNEWYKNGSTGLTCPECHSDFTELIEQDFDPRAASEAEHPLQGHNPWEDADDPDEDDIEEFHMNAMPRNPNTSHTYPRSGNVGGPPGTGPQRNQLPPFSNDLAGMFSRFQGIQGLPPGFAMPPGFAIPPDQGARPSDPFRPQSAPGVRSTRTSFTTTHTGPGVRVTVANGPGFSFTSRTSSSGGGWGHGQMGAQGMGPVDVNEMISGLFASIGGQPRRGTSGAANPFQAMFDSVFDPAAARHGDAVFSQEALDRVISQLMEQHPGGSAPGPATASAISGLPKKKLTADMLDENTGQAECSICMDNVPVGEEVTLLPCSHWFHFACVEAWLKEHDTCPVCRRGIMPKDGSRDSARSPTEAPLHDEDPVVLGRRQSGTRDHPFVVDESPSRARRRPSNIRRHSSMEEGSSGGGGGGGITDRVRNFFGGGSGAGSGNSSGNGR